MGRARPFQKPRLQCAEIDQALTDERLGNAQIQHAELTEQRQRRIAAGRPVKDISLGDCNGVRAGAQKKGAAHRQRQPEISLTMGAGAMDRLGARADAREFDAARRDDARDLAVKAGHVPHAARWQCNVIERRLPDAFPFVPAD